MEPASKIIDAFGGANAVAAIVGLHRTRVYAWKKPKTKSGTGGLIPIEQCHRPLREAKARGMAIVPADFFEPSLVGSEDQGYAVNSIRKHFIGNGGLGGAKAKRATMQMCLHIDWPVDNHNEADALAVWDYAGHIHGLRHSLPRKGLFDAR